MRTKDLLLPTLQSDRQNPDAAHGVPMADGHTVWVEGIISEVDIPSQLYTVETTTGATLVNTPRIVSSPGIIDILPQGTRVLVCKGPAYGPYIFGVVPRPANDGNILLPHLERDQEIQEGDNTLHAADGSCYVGALTGGTAVVYSTPMAHLSCNPNGHVDLMSGSFRHITAFGYSDITVTDDAVNYSIRGGASIQGTTSPELVDAWTLRIDAGSDAEMLDVRVTDTAGQTLARHYMSSSGALRQLATGGRIVEVSPEDSKIVEGREFTHIKGDSVTHVRDDRAEFYGTQETNVTGVQKVSVGGAATKTIGGQEIRLVSGQQNNILMDRTTYQIHGDYNRVLAPLYAGSIPKGQTANWINYSGGFNFVLQPTSFGKFSVFAMGLGAVQLGVDGACTYEPVTGNHIIVPIPAPFSATLFEPLKAWLLQFLAAYDLHTHPTPSGPSLPPLPTPDRVALNATMDLAMSQRVKIGL